MFINVNYIYYLIYFYLWNKIIFIHNILDMTLFYQLEYIQKLAKNITKLSCFIPLSFFLSPVCQCLTYCKCNINI